MLAPFFGLLSVNGAALAAKLLNAVLGAAAAGLIARHATKTRLLGPSAPRWLALIIVVAAAVAIPVLATQTVLFAEPLFAVLFAVASSCSPIGLIVRGPSISRRALRCSPGPLARRRCGRNRLSIRASGTSPGIGRGPGTGRHGRSCVGRPG